jgi:phosphatidylethanolamine/phosphatidyl-N-methylethanolamine N-methyltransferase
MDNSKMDNSKVERVYAAYSKVYDQIFGKVFQASRESAVRGLSIEPGARILDVGVGTGLSLPYYPPHCRIVGIDLSAEMLDQARRRMQKQKLDHVELMHMDAGHMAFEDDSFDLVMAAYVMTVVPNHRQVVNEMIRVCKPGGRIIVLNHFRNGNPILAKVEMAISPLCKHIGFRTDLTLESVLDGVPVRVERHEKVNPLRLWHLVECVNQKHF